VLISAAPLALRLVSEGGRGGWWEVPAPAPVGIAGVAATATTGAESAVRAAAGAGPTTTAGAPVDSEDAAAGSSTARVRFAGGTRAAELPAASRGASGGDTWRESDWRESDQVVVRGQWTYRCRLWMTAPSDAAAPVHASARLTTRTWHIVSTTTDLDAVSGPGVVGFYPHLLPLPGAGGPDSHGVTWSSETMQSVHGGAFMAPSAPPERVVFEYASATALVIARGSEGGGGGESTETGGGEAEGDEVDIVDSGQLAAGAMTGWLGMQANGGVGGGGFDAAVAPFLLEVPEFLYA